MLFAFCQGHLRSLFATLWLSCLALMAANTHADELLNGLASHKALNKELFIGALYSSTLSNQANDILADPGPRRIELRVTGRRLSARQLNQLWIEGMAINNPPSMLSEQAQNMVAFTAMIKRSLKAGDRLQITGDADGTHVVLNDVSLGNISAPGFFNMVLRTWIGSVPLSSDFRAGLLTNGEVETELLGRFESLHPSEERRRAIAAWLQPAPEETTSPAAPEPMISAPNLVAAPVIEQPAIASPDAAAGDPVVETSLSEAALADADSTDGNPKGSAIDAANSDPEEEEDESSEPDLTAESLLSRQLYHTQLLKWTYKYIRYPKRAINRNQEGSVRIAVVIDREGKVKQVSEVEGSRFTVLNQEAVRAVGRAEPFPPIPEAIVGEEFSFSLPIVFRLPK